MSNIMNDLWICKDCKAVFWEPIVLIEETNGSEDTVLCPLCESPSIFIYHDISLQTQIDEMHIILNQLKKESQV